MAKARTKLITSPRPATGAINIVMGLLACGTEKPEILIETSTET